jgi:hypothetical protein
VRCECAVAIASDNRLSRDQSIFGMPARWGRPEARDSGSFRRKCEGFRTSARTDLARGTGADVRKPPGKEPARLGHPAVPRVYGDLVMRIGAASASGDGSEFRSSSAITLLIGEAVVPALGCGNASGFGDRQRRSARARPALAGDQRQ